MKRNRIRMHKAPRRIQVLAYQVKSDLDKVEWGSDEVSGLLRNTTLEFTVEAMMNESRDGFIVRPIVRLVMPNGRSDLLPIDVVDGVNSNINNVAERLEEIIRSRHAAMGAIGFVARQDESIWALAIEGDRMVWCSGRIRGTHFHRERIETRTKGASWLQRQIRTRFAVEITDEQATAIRLEVHKHAERWAEMCDQGKADDSNGNGGIGILTLTLHVDSLDSDFYVAVMDRDRARFTGVDMGSADYLVLVRPGLSDREHDEMHAVYTMIDDPAFVAWTKGRGRSCARGLSGAAVGRNRG